MLSTEISRLVHGTLCTNKTSDFGRETDLVENRLTDWGHILAANLNRAMAALKTRRDPRCSDAGLAKVAKVSADTVHRARHGDAGISLANIAKIAKAIGMSPIQLLAPGLNPDSPPEIVSDPAEKAVLTMFRTRPPSKPDDYKSH